MAYLQTGRNQLNPYLISYQAYPYPSGTVEIHSINDMISYSPIIPSSSINISYNVGASGSYQFTYVLKNITYNTRISASISPNRYFTATPTGVILNPSQTGSIIISLNSSSLITDAGLPNTSSSIVIQITNITEATQSLQNINATLLTASRFLTPSIEVF